MNKAFVILIVAGLFLFQGCKERICDGYIVSKHYTPAHMVCQPIFNGKTTTVIPVRHPEHWEIVFEKDGRRRCVGVTHDLYNKAEVGDSVHVEKKHIKLYRRTCKEEIF